MDRNSTLITRHRFPIPAQVSRLLAMSAIVLLAVAGSGIAAAADHADSPHASRHSAMDNEHLRQVIEFVMARIEEPQREQVGKLAHAAFEQLDAIERQAEQVRAPRAQILLAELVDRAALERARLAELRVSDEHSRRVDQLLTDVAATLTPSQRARLRTEMVD